MRYPISLVPEEGLYSVTFPDVPEAITAGNNREHALEMGHDALLTALEFYFDDRRTIPLPSRIKRGGDFIELPPSVVAKVLLLNAMVAGEVRPIDLARRMGVSKSEVTRLLDLRYSTKIDAVAAALRAVGKSLEMQAV